MVLVACGQLMERLWQVSLRERHQTLVTQTISHIAITVMKCTKVCVIWIVWDNWLLKHFVLVTDLKFYVIVYAYLEDEDHLTYSFCYICLQDWNDASLEYFLWSRRIAIIFNMSIS